MKAYMKLKCILTIHVVALLLWYPSYAQMRSGDNVVIDEPVDYDLYVAGGVVTINAPVRGDLIVAGGTVIVNDTVTQDILAAGGNVSLNGFVADDIRCAGGTIELNGSVRGDFLVTGGEIKVSNNAIVFGNILGSGGEVTIDGNVKGNIRSASGAFTLNGTAEKELEAKGDKIVINGQVVGRTVMAANTIELGTDAQFDGKVSYWNKSGSLDFGNSLRGGNAVYDSSLEIDSGKWHYLGFVSFVMALWYLGTALVMILLIQYLFSMTLRNAAKTVRDTSLKSLGLGFLFLVGAPIAIVIVFITVIGIPVSILLLVAYITLLLLATVIVALLISNWINNTFYQSSWGNGRIVLAAFGIFIFLKLASLTPVIGPLIMLLLVCMAFGGILLNVKWRRNKALSLT